MTRSKLRRLRIGANRVARSEAQKWPQWMGFGEGDQWRIVRVPRAQWFARARRGLFERLRSDGWPAVRANFLGLVELAKRRAPTASLLAHQVKSAMPITVLL